MAIGVMVKLKRKQSISQSRGSSHVQLSVLSAASSLSVPERLQLIDELASGVPDDHPPRLSKLWQQEISQRSAEIDAVEIQTEDWLEVKARLFAKHVDDDAD